MVKWWHIFWLRFWLALHDRRYRELLAYEKCFEDFKGRVKYEEKVWDLRWAVQSCEYPIRWHEFCLERKALPEAKVVR